MALLIILIAIIVQRFLKFNSYSHQFDWATHYFQWCNKKVKAITSGHGLVGVAILVVPLMLLTSIVFGIFYGFFGVFGAGILQLALLWYCLDARDIKKEPYENTSPDFILSTSYQHLFSILFWFGFFGPVGLVLYVSVRQLSQVVHKSLPAPEETVEIETASEVVEEKSSVSLHEMLVKVQAVLDWVPVRLLGLTFALVGSFGAVFKLWLQKLFDGLSDVQSLVIEWGHAAIKQEPKEGDANPHDPAIQLVDRSLLVWLVVIFLLTVGVLLG